MGTKGILARRKNLPLRVSSEQEAEAPKPYDLDSVNVWDPDLGWVLKNGKPTIQTKAFWAKMKRKFKQ